MQYDEWTNDFFQNDVLSIALSNIKEEDERRKKV